MELNSLKKCIFFSLVGDYDEVKEPAVITPGWDYLCFTNNKKLKSKTWKFKYIKTDGLDFYRAARRVWVMYHKYVNDYDLSISTGAQMQPRCDLNKFVRKFLPDDESVDISLPRHPNRTCIYDEGRKCYKKDKKEIIDKQMNFYKSEGYPKNNGLIATGIMIRRHHRKNLEEHCERWWDQIMKHSFRDQLSFNYILWKYNLIKINYFSYQIVRGEGGYFKKYPHKHDKKKRKK